MKNSQNEIDNFSYFYISFWNDQFRALPMTLFLFAKNIQFDQFNSCSILFIAIAFSQL